MSGLSAPVLAVQHLHREFGGVHAVNGASFTVPPGRITGLIGPNGAGKSTALNIIAGALKPSAGTVSYHGKDITGLPSYKVARHGIIRTFQLSSEFAALTVLENLLVAAPAQRGEALWQAALGKRYWRPQERAMVERARQLLARFDMSAKEDEYAGNLSGGQKRLLELMRGLMANPALLLLDEPMAGVADDRARAGRGGAAVRPRRGHGPGTGDLAGNHGRHPFRSRGAGCLSHRIAHRASGSGTQRSCA